MPRAMRGVVTSSKIGMPIATAPPKPALDTAVVSTAQKAKQKNSSGLTTSIDERTEVGIIFLNHSKKLTL